MNPAKSLLEAFRGVVPVGKRSVRGWTNFNCPMCTDTRGRCGFLETETGGFRIRCWNAGCELNDAPTGWEPGGGFGGKPRRVFEALGGDPRDLPLTDLFRKADTYDRSGRLVLSADAPRLRFDRIDLPRSCVPIADACPDTEEQERGLVGCINYMVDDLGEELSEAIEAMWTPEHPYHVIVPFRHHGEVVGWIGRKCSPGKNRFIGFAQPDYIYRQDTLERTDARAAIVVEGVMDADAIIGVAIRNSSPTKKQVALLDGCGQRIIVLPDWSADATKMIDVAETHGWDVSVPDWDAGIKDPCDAVRRYGRLYAIATVVSGAAKNYLKARAAARMRTIG